MQQSQDFTPPPIRVATLRDREVNTAAANLSVELIYVNLFVLIAGGFGSYFLARRSLLPIERAHEAQSRFTSDASHELRTPLAVMKTELEVAIRDNTATTDSLKEVLSSNLEEVDKLSRLAEMLLNLSQLDQAKLKLGPVNLNKVTHDIIKDFNKPSDRISMVYDKKLMVKGDEMAVTDLIKVLVENAIQYSPKDSQVSIALSQFEEYAKFEITNSGPGVQPDKLPYIFDRFYRADSSRTNGKNKGYGFGLALAKNIVELHNGKLFVSSAPEYETTFTFLLPLYSNIQAKIQN
jgi:signal transduction histidine kinase